MVGSSYNVAEMMMMMLTTLYWTNTFKLSAVDHGFEPRTYQAKDFKIGICYLSNQQVELTGKCKDWLARIRIKTIYKNQT
jgi:hypothetical protein